MYPVSRVTSLEDLKGNLCHPNPAALVTYNQLPSDSKNGKSQKSFICFKLHATPGIVMNSHAIILHCACDMSFMLSGVSMLYMLPSCSLFRAILVIGSSQCLCPGNPHFTC